MCSSDLLSAGLREECLFIIKQSRELSEPFNKTWTLEQAREWGRANAHRWLTPETVTKGSHAYALWQCWAAGHMWTAMVCDRGKGTGCPACYNERRAELFVG